MHVFSKENDIDIIDGEVNQNKSNGHHEHGRLKETSILTNDVMTAESRHRKRCDPMIAKSCLDIVIQ